ncbi:unnamed protein product [Cuscuta epithymum]|uniref:amino-acid N-acetyltransferase n=1 Tax=Cuscuta epithymum TaxID=186058 RepID=A0AAV0FSS7_9ASTE|nr:unnamed protein product [Cuscuta epithymum]
MGTVVEQRCWLSSLRREGRRRHQACSRSGRRETSVLVFRRSRSGEGLGCGHSLKSSCCSTATSWSGGSCSPEKGYVEEEGEVLVAALREAEPNIAALRGCTLVVVISAEVADNPHHLSSLLEDISLLHEFGIKFVLVPGTHVQINKLLSKRGSEPKYVGHYRITDTDSLEAAMDAAARIRILLEAKLSPGPPLSLIRRHGDSNRWHDGVRVTSGNFLAAKRRGVVEGIDYGSTGEVKKIDVSRIRERLDQESIVIISNVGYSSSGHILNCNTYEVATACALALRAEKVIFILDGPILDESGRLIRFLTVQDADLLVRRRAYQSETAATYVKAVSHEDLPLGYQVSNGLVFSHNRNGYRDKYNPTFHNGVGFDNGNEPWSGERGSGIGGQERLNRCHGYLSELATAAFVCSGGVQRVHLLDGTIDGVLLKELFQRDGFGTMVASDLYEGIRMARALDIPGITQLLQPLEKYGTLAWRTEEELIVALDSFVVVERESQIIACASLFAYLKEKCGEVAFISVSPKYRGQGQGDKLLDYIEKKASSLGIQMLFLRTTRTEDWFVRRGFSECCVGQIPVERRKRINVLHGSKCYMKRLLPDRSSIHFDNVSLA